MARCIHFPSPLISLLKAQMTNRQQCFLCIWLQLVMHMCFLVKDKRNQQCQCLQCGTISVSCLINTTTSPNYYQNVTSGQLLSVTSAERLWPELDPGEAAEVLN